MYSMAIFSSTDLKQEYRWETREHLASQIEGFPSDKILNCTQGYEMLHFLNRYMDDIGWVTVVSFNNIELLIKTQLPFGRRTHKDVKEWLDILLRR